MPAWGQVQAPHVWGDGRIQPACLIPPALRERAPRSPLSQDSPYRLRQRLRGLLRDKDVTGKSVVSRVLGDEPKISEGREWARLDRQTSRHRYLSIPEVYPPLSTGVWDLHPHKTQ